MNETIEELFRGKPDGIESIEYRCSEDEMKLIPLGDVHLGAPTCNIQKFLDTVTYIKKSGSRVILMGDLMECASKTSVGAGWVEQVNPPQTQLNVLYDILEPIKDQIIVVLDGNHEHRIWKSSGIKVSEVLAQRLGVPYGGYSCFVGLTVGGRRYVIHAQHGSSSAWYPHTKITAAMRTSNHTLADVYLYGHTHELMSLTLEKRELKKIGRGSRVDRKKVYYVLTGGFLEYEYLYAERKNMYPVKTGVAKIKFCGDRWDVHVST